ncbi:MAG TPA: stage II sporulation protein P [Bacillota bacterium]
MRFRPPWPLIGLYALTAFCLLLVLGPLSRAHLLVPLAGGRMPADVPSALAVPALVEPDFQEPAAPATVPPPTGEVAPSLWALWRHDLSAWVRESLLSLETFKSFLRVAMPGLATAEAAREGGRPVGLSLHQILTRGFEVAAGVELGRPWTILAAELPALRLAEVPESDAPLAVAIEMVLPQWQYEQLLAQGTGGIEPLGGDGQTPGGAEPDRAASGGVEPRVLVYHTHGTEAYLGPISVRSGIDPNVVGFTADPDRNIIRVGAELVRALRSHGIGTLHLTELFDWQNQLVTRAGAYVRSLEALEDFAGGRSVLEVYPSLRLIIDVHRDAVARELVALRVDERTVAARILLIVGSRDNPHWRANYCFAQRLHQQLEARVPGISRGVMVRHDARFNQHLLPGSLLIEIGSVENTLAEALFSARVVADVIARAFADGWVPEPGRPYPCNL